MAARWATRRSSRPVRPCWLTRTASPSPAAAAATRSLEPVYIKTAKCLGCPPNYQPPKGCAYGSDECYRLYPSPPKVKGGRRKRRPAGTTTTYTNPRAAFLALGGHSTGHLHPQCVRIQAERDPVREAHAPGRRERELQPHHERLGQRLLHVPARGRRDHRHLHGGGHRPGLGRPRQRQHDREGHGCAARQPQDDIPEQQSRRPTPTTTARTSRRRIPARTTSETALTNP